MWISLSEITSALSQTRVMVVIVGADTIAKLSAETSRDRSFAAWDQRIVIPRCLFMVLIVKSLYWQNQHSEIKCFFMFDSHAVNHATPIYLEAIYLKSF